MSSKYKIVNNYPPPLYSIILTLENNGNNNKKSNIGLIYQCDNDNIYILQLDTIGKTVIPRNSNWIILNCDVKKEKQKVSRQILRMYDLDQIRYDYKLYINQSIKPLIDAGYKEFEKKYLSKK